MGQLGHNIDRLLGHNIVHISTGYVHTLLLDKTGCIGARLGEYPIPRPMTPLWKQHNNVCWT